MSNLQCFVNNLVEFIPVTDAKKQHYVPVWYLKQFVDSSTPAGQEPYVWVFNKDGKKKERRAPKNVLWETDLYTFNLDGTKHYELEKALSDIEREYAAISRRKIAAFLPLSDAEHASLCIFVALMLQRTVRHRDRIEDFFDELISLTERIEQHHRVAASTSRTLRNQKKDVHKISILQSLSSIARLLGEMRLAFLCSETNSRFITSDDPVTLFNPDLQWQRFYGPGLAQQGIQLTMPVSPAVTLCMTWSNLRGYIRIPRSRIEDLNRLTRAHCYKNFISHSPKAKLIWFSPVPLHDPWFLLLFAKRKITDWVGRLVREYRNRHGSV